MPTTWNAVSILERSRSLILQDAVDEIGDICASKLRELAALQTSIKREGNSSPSDSGPETRTRAKEDRALYARALVHCVMGLLYWAFETEWYFGADAPNVRLTMFIDVPDEDRESSV